MLLRASGVTRNKDYDLGAVLGGGGDAGVPHGRLLVEFAEAVLGEDDARLGRARAGLLAALSPAGLVGTGRGIDRVSDGGGPCRSLSYDDIWRVVP